MEIDKEDKFGNLFWKLNKDKTLLLSLNVILASIIDAFTFCIFDISLISI